MIKNQTFELVLNKLQEESRERNRTYQTNIRKLRERQKLTSFDGKRHGFTRTN